MAAAILVLYVLTKILSTNCIKDDREGDVTKRENFIFWADGIIPFFIDPRHFDTDQQLAITSALVKFSFKTCLQFKPVLEEPMPDKHVLVLENPHGIRKCVINTKGHAVDEPHRVTIGFDCMTSPHIDMMMMRALGFPFEHNRASRDIYIDILFQNVDQGAIELYTKEQKLPIELRALPYDVNSVLHFSNREYSKNGHRTFIFKNPNTYQNRVGLSPTDLQKINIIYGPECKTRDRFAKLKICSNYPANKRRKREVHSENNKTNVLLEFDNKTETSFSIGEEQNVSNILQEAEKNLRTLPLKSEENNSEQLIKEFNFEGKNIARQNNVDKLILDLVRKIRQVRRLSIALAKKKNKSTRTGTTDEDIALTLVNLLYTSLKDTAATEDKLDSDIKSVRSSSKEKYKDKQLYSTKFLPAQDKTDENGDNESAGSDFEKMKRSKIRKKVKGEQFYSTRNRPARGETYESGKSASAENDYATKKTEKSKFGKKVKGEQFYSTRFRPAGGEIDESGKTASADIDYATEKIVKTKIRPVYASTQFRNIFPYTQYSIGREKVSKEETSSAKQKREVNMIGEGSDKVSTTPHNGPIENITLNKDTRRTFMDRYLFFDNEYNGNIWVENYATITLPHFGIAKQINNEVEIVEKANLKEKEIIENDLKTTKTSKTKDYTAIDDIQFKNSFGTTRKMQKYALPQTVKLTQENKDFYGERIWPEGTVFFVIENYTNYDLNDVRLKLEKVNKILQTYTCVELQEINEEDENKSDYIVLDTSADFVVGRVGGRQNFGVLELFEGGQHQQHAAMVVMSMLGFYFEPARHDRDQYVLVHTRHIRPDKVHHFEKLHGDATLALPYDYRSATHPPWQYWRRLGKSGIASVATFKDKDPDGKIMKSLGQNSRLLSKTDLVKINSVYGTACFDPDVN